MSPTGSSGDREVPKEKAIGIEVTPSGEVVGDNAELQKRLAEKEAKEKKSRDAMLMAVGVEESRIAENIAGDPELFTPMPGQETAVAEFVKSESVRTAIDDKRKESSKSMFDKGQNNHYANIAINYTLINEMN